MKKYLIIQHTRKTTQENMQEAKYQKKIFEEILKQLYEKGMIQAKVIFGDATHVKANANKKKAKDVVIKEISKGHQEELVKEINEDRIRHGKKN